MDWKFLFNTQIEDNEKLIIKIISIFEDEYGERLNTERVLSILAQTIMHASSSIGMNSDDFSNMLDAIDEEYPGW